MSEIQRIVIVYLPSSYRPNFCGLAFLHTAVLSRAKWTLFSSLFFADMSCFQGLFSCPEAYSLLLHNFCVYHISPPGHEVRDKSLALSGWIYAWLSLVYVPLNAMIHTVSYFGKFSRGIAVRSCHYEHR